jgi:mannose-6-phosphate isomerase-like protein (cupin superfamily)
MSAGADAFATLALADAPLVKAPDGSDVRPLLSLAGGSLAHFELAAGKTSIAVTHRSVEEIWFVIGGRGEMWRKQAERKEIVALHAGVALTIPLGTAFQFRSFGPQPLTMVAITMPPWPGDDEAYQTEGEWPPSL